MLVILNGLEALGLGLVLLSELGDHVNQTSVLLHDGLVLVLSLDGCCLLSLVEYLHAVF